MSASGPRSLTLRTAAALFLACVATFLLLFNGRLGIVDGELMFRMTESLVERGSAAIPEHEYASKGKDGQYYSKYGPLQSVLAVPLYAAGKVAADRAAGRVSADQVKRAAVALFNPLALAALTTAIFLLGLQWGFGPGRALAAALISTFCTTYWYLSKTFNSEPLTGLCLVLAFLFLLRARDGSLAAVALSGLFVGLAGMTRPVALVIAPLLGIYLLLARKDRIATAAAFGAPLVAVVLCLAAYNAMRFGSPLQSGYFDEKFTTPLWVGVPGLLFSPRCGMLFYTPLLLLAIPGARVAIQRHQAEVLLIGGVFAVWLLLSGAWWCWWGGWGVGPRLLLPVCPLLALLATAALPSWSTASRGTRALVLGVVVVCAGQQLIPLLASHPEWKQIEVTTRERGHDEMWDFRYMPLAWQAGNALQAVNATVSGSWRNGAAPTAASAFDLPVLDAWPAYLMVLGVRPILPLALAGLLMAGALGAAWWGRRSLVTGAAPCESFA